MGRRLLAASAIVLVLLGVGYLAQQALERPQEDALGQAVAPSPVTIAPTKPALAKSPRQIRVTAVQGSVEQRPDESSTWRSVSVGDVLDTMAAIRTGADGSLALQLDDARVRLDPDTRLAVSTLSDTVARVRLKEGRVAAQMPSDGGSTFGVEVEGSDAVAETQGGDFSVLSSGHGVATVATQKGAVRVRAKGKTVRLAAGQQSLVRPGRAPGAPVPIPSSLFLKVRRPTKQLKRPRYAVAGTSVPGSVITVEGRPVQVDDSGAFRVMVALREGSNRVRVTARDALGRRRESELQVRVDSKGPEVGGAMQWADP